MAKKSFKVPRIARIIVNVIAYTLITLVAITNIIEGKYELAFWQVMTLVFMILCDVASVIQDKQLKLIDMVIADLDTAIGTLRDSGETMKKQDSLIKSLQSKKGKK